LTKSKGSAVGALADKRSVRLTREQRIAEILRAAREVFRERGYESATVSEIASRLGVVEGLIYKYFDSKRALLSRVLGQWYEHLYGDYEHSVAGIRGHRQQLRHLIWRHLRTLSEDVQMCRLIFTELRVEPNYLESDLHEMNRRYTQLLVEVLESGVREREFRQDLPVTLVRDMVFGCIEHHLWGFLFGQRSLEADHLADQITELVCEGIVTRAEAQCLSGPTQRLVTLIDRMESVLANTTQRTA
jgi:AcrR family transcriptional regulator